LSVVFPCDLVESRCRDAILVVFLAVPCLEELTMDVAQAVKTKRDQILAIAERHGAHHVRVFGSAARGEAGPESDVDLLVEVGPQRTPFFPGGLIADLEELLGCRVEVVTPDALHARIRQQVLEEAVPL
jgi:uncharacterized protein